jgi:hypothetical protein
MNLPCRAGSVLALLVLCSAASGAAAAPFLPTDDGMVLQSGLPTADPRMRQIHALATRLKQQPGDRDLAMQLAADQLAMGVADADPRLVGNAQGTLAPWWTDRGPVALLVLRGRIDQAKHDFAAARTELHAALAAEPGNLQGLLVLAGVDEVIGDLDEGKAACETLARLRPGLFATACLSGVESLTGQAEASYRALADALYHGHPGGGEMRLWALTILGEIAARRGASAADDYFKEALLLDRHNVYALTAYADYLLDHGRAAEIPPLLGGLEAIDALYLRLALAAQATGDAKLERYRKDLAERFAAARRQGDTLHLRDAARFALDLEHDPPRALDLALRNWATQRTPVDVRIVLEAALAAAQPAAARPIAEWVARTGLEDVAIAQLLGRLGPG